MTLSQKILGAIIVTVAGLGLTLFAAWSVIQLRSYAQLEQQDADRDVQRAIDALAAQQAFLISKVLDWSNWDDSYHFIETRDPEFVASNLTSKAVSDLDVDALLFFDNAGQLVASAVNDTMGEEALAKEQWLQLTTANPGLLVRSGADGPVTGIAMLGRVPILVAAAPILTSDGQGPKRGTAIFAKVLDTGVVQELSGTTHLSLSISNLDDPEIEGELQAIGSGLSVASPIAIRPLDGATVAGYALLSDIAGQPRLILRMDKPRSLYQQGQSVLLTFTFALVLFGLILSVIILTAMRRLVLVPLSQLRDGVEHVGSGELEYRIPVHQQDEIGQLAFAFNEMAARLRQREQQLSTLAQKLRLANSELEERVAERTAELQEEVNERQRAQEALQAYASRLERSNRELEDFAYVSSHDLQEPLRKIQAFGDRLRDKYGEALDDQGRDYLGRMQSAAARMQSLIEGLLTYSRVTTKAQPFVTVDLQQVARDVLADLEMRIAEVQGVVEVFGLPTIEADPLQMRQLIQNLLGNALKFHRDGVAPVIIISGERLNGHSPSFDGAPPVEMCQIRVADNGIGFDEKYCDRIFQVFQRLHGRGVYEGAGIGLSVCRKIAERHGGLITARSTLGQGSTFTVTLPVSQAPGAN